MPTSTSHDDTIIYCYVCEHHIYFSFNQVTAQLELDAERRLRPAVGIFEMPLSRLPDYSTCVG